MMIPLYVVMNEIHQAQEPYAPGLDASSYRVMPVLKMAQS